MSDAIDIGALLRECGVDRLCDFTPPSEIGEAVQTLVTRASGLKPLTRELVYREAIALAKDNKLPGLRRLIDAARVPSMAGEAPSQGSRVFLADPEPWLDPVDGAELLDDLAATVRAHVYLTNPSAADAIALWVVHTYALDVAHVTPRLAALSPTKRCGKTTLLRLLGALVSRALSVANLTAPTLFRSVQAFHPTLLIDEADAFAKDNEELGGVLNAGHAHDGAVVRCTGDEHEPTIFKVFAPVAIAGIGTLRDTLLDRSIVVQMRRAGAGDHLASLRARDLAALEPLRRRCARWVSDNIEALRTVPNVPAALNDRAADNWEPLLAIADVIGMDWPERARVAAVALSASAAADTDSESIGIQLLGDVRDALRGRDRVSMRQLVDALVGVEDRPWATINKGKPLDTNGLGRRLRPFGVRVRTMRLEGAGVVKGYTATDFADAFVRYLAPSVDPVTSAELQPELRNRAGLRYPAVTGGQLRESGNDSEHVTGTRREGRERVAL